MVSKLMASNGTIKFDETNLVFEMDCENYKYNHSELPFTQYYFPHHIFEPLQDSYVSSIFPSVTKKSFFISVRNLDGYFSWCVV